MKKELLLLFVVLTCLTSRNYSFEIPQNKERTKSQLWLSTSRRDVIQQTASGLLLPSAAANAEEEEEMISTTTTPTTSTKEENNNIIVPQVRLGKSNLFVSRTIQGYWQLAGGHGRYKESDAIANMQAHFDKGITTLDTADIYGPSEIIIGKFIKQQQQNVVNAKAPIIPCTKFCCFRFLDEIDRTEVRQRIQRACDRLQVSKLPLVQFFWSNYDIKRYIDVGLWLMELKQEGLIGELGATNFDLKRLQELKKADISIISHQVQLSAMDRRSVQSGMSDWCFENDISLIAFGTVASGILSDKYHRKKSAPTQEEKNTASMRMYSNTAARFGDWKLVQELLDVMNVIANQVRNDGRCLECNISNVAQRYILDGVPAVASVLIGVRNQNHLEENIRTHSFRLTPEECRAIDAVVEKRKGPQGDVWDIERGVL